jgi:hypothetical protein
MDLQGEVPDHSFLTSAIQIYAPEITTVRGLSRSISASTLVLKIITQHSQHLPLVLGNPMAVVNVRWVIGFSIPGSYFMSHNQLLKWHFCHPRKKCGQENSFSVTMMHVVHY